MSKRVFSLLLALTMIIGMISVCGLALAENPAAALDTEWLGEDLLGGTGTKADPYRINYLTAKKIKFICNGTGSWSGLYESANFAAFESGGTSSAYGDYGGVSGNEQFPTYSGNRSQRLINDGWGLPDAYATKAKPTDKLYVFFVFGDGGYSKANMDCLVWFKFVDPTPVVKSLTLSKTTFTKGEKLTATLAGIEANDHVMIFPKPRKNYSTSWGYKNFSGGETSYSFDTANLAVGDYYISLLDHSGAWVFVTDLEFTVTEPTKYLTLAKTTFTQGEMLTATLKGIEANDHVMIFPKPRKTYNTSWGYKNYSGGETSYSFNTANLEPGTYYISLLDHSGAWVFVTDLEFTVTAPAKTMSIPKTTYIQGEPIIATLTGTEADDHVMIFPKPRTNYNTSWGYKKLTAGATSYSYDTANLPAGNYYISFLDHASAWQFIKDIEFTVILPDCSVREDGSVTVNKEGYALSDVPVTEKLNKQFIGWKNSDETLPGSTLSAGDELIPQYIDCDLSENEGGDFWVSGVQIRTAAPQALRFIAYKSAGLQDALPQSDIEYGILLLPQKVLKATDKQLVYGETYNYNNKTVNPAIVKGINTFDKTDSGIHYTACLTDIPEAQYGQDITARGYIRYTDLNGATRTIYSFPYTAEVSRTAQATLDTYGETMSKEDKALLEHILEIAPVVNEEETYTIAQLVGQNKGVLSGRASLNTNGTITANQSNAGFRFIGTLDGSFDVELSHTSGTLTMDVVVDGELFKSYPALPNETQTVKVTGIVGRHTIEVIRASASNFGSTTFKSITISTSANLAAPAVSPVQIEFLGDSITCADGIRYIGGQDLSNGSVRYQDAYYSYAAQTARALNADLSVVARCGAATAAYTDANDDFLKGIKAGSKDILVINLGTNDSSTTDAALTQSVNTLIAKARAQYPDAYIIWTYGMMYTPKLSTLKAAVEGYAITNSDSKVSFFDISKYANTSGGYSHPSQATHDAVATALTAYIRETCAELFE